MKTLPVPFPPSHHHKKRWVKVAWAEAVLSLVRSSFVAPPPGDVYEFRLDIYGPWRRADGTLDPKMPDCKNLVWELEDIVAEALGYNDRANWGLTVRKHQAALKFCVVTLRPYTEDNP